VPNPYAKSLVGRRDRIERSQCFTVRASGRPDHRCRALLSATKEAEEARGIDRDGVIGGGSLFDEVPAVLGVVGVRAATAHQGQGYVAGARKLDGLQQGQLSQHHGFRLGKL
jgi:hypothetical protein